MESVGDGATELRAMENEQLTLAVRATGEGQGKRKRKVRARDADVDEVKRRMIEEAIRRYKERHPGVKRITDCTLDIIKTEIEKEQHSIVTLEELRAVNLWVRQRINNRVYRRSARRTMVPGGKKEMEDRERRMGEGVEMIVVQGGTAGNNDIAGTDGKPAVDMRIIELEEEVSRWMKVAEELESRREAVEAEAARTDETKKKGERSKEEEERAKEEIESMRKEMEKWKERAGELDRRRMAWESEAKEGLDAKKEVDVLRVEIEKNDRRLARFALELRKKEEKEREWGDWEENKKLLLGEKARAEQLEREKERLIKGKEREEQRRQREKEALVWRAEEAEKEGFKAALWEVVKTAQEANNRLMRTWCSKINTVWNTQHWQGWKGKLSAEERRKHLVRVHRGEGVIYDEKAYRDEPGDLWILVRNVAAHRRAHGFDGDDGVYNWVEEKWPYFWPVMAMVGCEMADDTGLGNERYRWIAEKYQDSGRRWLYGQEARIGKLRELMAKAETLIQLPLEKRKEGELKPEQEDRKMFAQNFWEVVAAVDNDYNVDRKRRRWGNWFTVCDVVYGENSGRGQWRVDGGLEGRAVLMKGDNWIADDNARGMKEVILEVRRSFAAKGRENWEENLAWVRKRWPWAVTLWVGTSLVFNWGECIWYVNPALEEEWGRFMMLWMEGG